MKKENAFVSIIKILLVLVCVVFEFFGSAIPAITGDYYFNFYSVCWLVVPLVVLLLMGIQFGVNMFSQIHLPNGNGTPRGLTSPVLGVGLILLALLNVFDVFYMFYDSMAYGYSLAFLDYIYMVLTLGFIVFYLVLALSSFGIIKIKLISVLISVGLIFLSVIDFGIYLYNSFWIIEELIYGYSANFSNLFIYLARLSTVVQSIALVVHFAFAKTQHNLILSTPNNDLFNSGSELYK